MAPKSPSIDIKNKITPHARMPLIIGKSVTMAEALPYKAVPIKMNEIA